ncbi:MFS transporter [Brevibacterium oceani]|uniref:MFS transporter n=1 Tax=Brevibacterium oceani TaxID=358099 RepID=UPI0015E63AB1|nr:MFS transporter [Brevibacterium oceani]
MDLDSDKVVARAAEPLSSTAFSASGASFPLPAEVTEPAAGRMPAPRRGLTFFILLAIIGAGAGQMTAALLTMTLKANSIDAGGATTILSISAAVTGVFTLVAFPIIGALSDRSRSALGRRRPYLALGALFYLVGGILLILANDVALLVVAHLLITAGFVTANVIIAALATDQLPEDRRGPVMALISLGAPVGAMVGMAMVSPFGDAILPLVGLPTALAVLGMLLLAAMVRDPESSLPKPPFSLRAALGIFWVNPIRFPDFMWVFTSRMLVFSGVAAINAYQGIYLLQGLHVPAQKLGFLILLTVVVNAGITLLVAPAVGKLSDRLGVRRPFILVAAVVLGIGLVLAAFAPNFAFYLVACTVVGFGQGVYFAVELVLATQVLPDPANPAKDIGIIKIADNLPITIVAAVAPALLAISMGAGGGQNFAALFIAGALSAMIGGLVILFVRGAR